MKKIIISLITMLLLIVSVCVGQENATRYRVDEIYADVCDILDIDPEVTICYVPNRLTSEITGITVKNHNGSYTIHLSKALGANDWKKVLIHEMVHVFQMENGSIEIIKGKKYWYGFIPIDGERHSEYNELHEMQAREFADIIYNKIVR
jgi:hypothetical protein